MAPIWTDPPRRLVNAFRRLRQEAVDRQAESITVDPVDAVHQRSGALVDGVTVPTSGEAQLTAGQLVPVVRKKGRPKLILAHSARRAQFPGVPVTTALGIVEELYIAHDPDTNHNEVYFRNYDQITRLDLRDQIGNVDPGDVIWGVNPDVFGVKTGDDTWHVFRLKRTVNKIIAKDTKVQLRDKLYQVSLSANPALVLTLDVHLSRTSHPPVFEHTGQYTWNPAPPPPLSPQFEASYTFDGLNRDGDDLADVTRRVTVSVKGFQENPQITESVFGAQTGTVKVDPRQVIIDDQNEVLYEVDLRFVDFGARQTASTFGLTGTRAWVIEGTRGGPFGNASCPHLMHTDPIVGFNDNGNPGEVVAAHITETHTVLIRAQTGTVVWSTFKATQPIVLDIVESTQGRIGPGIFMIHGQFLEAVFSPGDPEDFSIVVQEFTCTMTIDCAYYRSNGATNNVGFLGQVGITDSPRSLFEPTLTFQPEAGRPRAALLTIVETGSFAIPTATNPTIDDWTAHLTEVVDRYRIFVTADVFYTENGIPYQFVAVNQVPRRPEGFESDLRFIGAFIVKGSTVLATAQAYTAVGDAEPLPVLLRGNSHRVLWGLGTFWFMTDFINGVTRGVGTDILDPKVAALYLTNPDFLYASREQDRFFVNGWRGRTITLSQSATGFPPRSSKLAGLGLLKDLPSGVSPVIKSYHTIDDRNLVAATPSTPTP